MSTWTPEKGKTASIIALVMVISLFGLARWAEQRQTESPREAPITTGPPSPPPPPPAPPTAWLSTPYANRDELTGAVSHWSVRMRDAVRPTRRLAFPYGGMDARMYAVCSSGERPYIGIVFSSSPNITGDETESGYSWKYHRVSVDGNVQRHRFTQEWGSNNLFSRDGTLLARIKGGNAMRLELDLYSEGSVVFPFSLTGSRAAIDALAAKCGS